MNQGAFGFMQTVVANISLVGATEVRVRMKKPDETIVDRTLSSTDVTVVDAPTGTVSFLVRSGDLDQSGVYLIQVSDLTPGRLIPSRVVEFQVRPSI